MFCHIEHIFEKYCNINTPILLCILSSTCIKYLSGTRYCKIVGWLVTTLVTDIDVKSHDNHYNQDYISL